MELQAECVGAEAMTAEAIRVEVELELLDRILRRAAVVVPRDEIGGPAAAIGDHEAHVEARRRDVVLTRIRRGWGHDFARCQKLVRICTGRPRCS